MNTFRASHFLLTENRFTLDRWQAIFWRQIYLISIQKFIAKLTTQVWFQTFWLVTCPWSDDWLGLKPWLDTEKLQGGVFKLQLVPENMKFEALELTKTSVLSEDESDASSMNFSGVSVEEPTPTTSNRKPLSQVKFSW